MTELYVHVSNDITSVICIQWHNFSYMFVGHHWLKPVTRLYSRGLKQCHTYSRIHFNEPKTILMGNSL